MKLKIIVENGLEEFHGKMSYNTYGKIPLDKRPKLIDNTYFYLSNLKNTLIVIQIDRNIIEDGNNLYLHQSGKDLYYSDLEIIEI